MGSGRPASIDYAINMEGDNHMINCIPIEAKHKLDNLPSLEVVGLVY